MSKKQAKSDRDIDLPDWADDVTPSDEVMQKFYAPTGLFKTGPIGVPIPPLSPSDSTFDENEPVKEIAARDIHPGNVEQHTKFNQTSIESPLSRVTSSDHLKVVITPKESFEAGDFQETIDSPGRQHSQSHQLQNDASPAGESHQTDLLNSQLLASDLLPTAQTVSFNEFANRWKRYLYPGQLAVMRTLFDMTFAVGTSECFTQYSQLAILTKMTRRNCINVMNSLVERGFVERLEVRNDASSKGIKLRVHPDPR